MVIPSAKFLRCSALCMLATGACSEGLKEGAAAEQEQSSSTQSRIISITDAVVAGETACKVEFSYSRFDREDILWAGERCESLSVSLVNQADLESWGKWDRLDDFSKRHIRALPEGLVLYVEGEFTASVYPVGTTRESYEVSVAD